MSSVTAWMNAQPYVHAYFAFGTCLPPRVRLCLFNLPHRQSFAIRLCYARESSGLLHYMWGVNPLNQLMKPDGTPTDLGYYYIYS